MPAGHEHMKRRQMSRAYIKIVIVSSRFLQRPQKRSLGNQLSHRRLSKTKSIGSGFRVSGSLAGRYRFTRLPYSVPYMCTLNGESLSNKKEHNATHYKHEEIYGVVLRVQLPQNE